MTLAELAQSQLQAQLGQAALILTWLAVTAVLLAGWGIYEALVFVGVIKRPQRPKMYGEW